MEAKQVPEVILSSGHKMPMVGLGTAFPPEQGLSTILVDAIRVGYRHFDTASSYGTEVAVGQALAAALDQRLINSRDDIFITSKLWCSDTHPDLVLPALKATLRRLGLEYVNLYLIHFPTSFREGVVGMNFTKEDLLPIDISGTWKAMEECQRLGLAKSIGVSSFGCKKLTQLLQYATIPPAVNQVEMNISWQQNKLVNFCKNKGIHVTAWSPLGGYRDSWGSKAVMESPILKEIAASKGKTVAQIALRWIYEQGASLVVKSFNKERMEENLQIFDWELSVVELENIKKQVPQRRLFSGDCFVFEEHGPYRSLEELWDDDP